MKEFWKRFCLRGLVAMGFGPMVLAIIYGILGATGAIRTLSPATVTKAIVSISLLAFIAGGMGSIYQVEKLPLIVAVLLHGAFLYLGYLLMYLINDWIPKNAVAIGIFTGCFFGGFLLIWLFIYFCTKRKTTDLNKHFKQG